MTRIQECLTATIECLLEVVPFLLGKPLDDFGPVCSAIMATFAQPVLFLPVPTFDDVARNRIVCLKRDEHDRTRLRPMRATVLVDEQLTVRIKGFAQHCGDPSVAPPKLTIVPFRSAKGATIVPFRSAKGAAPGTMRADPTYSPKQGCLVRR
jgi:hypothetical protein